MVANGGSDVSHSVVFLALQITKMYKTQVKPIWSSGGGFQNDKLKK
jgi:hypothetical protein